MDLNTVPNQGGEENLSMVQELLKVREERETRVEPQESEPQAKIEAEQTSSPEPKPEKPTMTVEDALKEIEALRVEKERLAKQAADSRKWGNEQNMKLKNLLKEGAIDEETASQLASNDAVLSDNPFKVIGERWNEDVRRLQPILEKVGQDPKAYQEAFFAWFDTLPEDVANATANQIQDLPEDELTPFMLEKGKDYYDSFYSEVKQSGGSLIEAYKASRDKSTKLEADYAALKDKYDSLRAELKAELNNGYGKKATLQGGSENAREEDIEDLRPISSVALIEDIKNERLGIRR